MSKVKTVDVFERKGFIEKHLRRMPTKTLEKGLPHLAPRTAELVEQIIKERRR